MSDPSSKPATSTPGALTRKIHAEVLELLQGEPNAKHLEQALRHLAKWRARVIDNTITKHDGRTVQSGPFKGMTYEIRATEGAGPARLLGSYEAILIPVFETIIAEAYPVVMDVGCAEGYYAVGLARRMPAAQILAFDTNMRAQNACALLAEKNGVQDRVRVGSTVAHADFDRCRDAKTLVLMDIEGAEKDLLDPLSAPGLTHADILVEVHDCFHPGLTDMLTERFADTHRVARYDRTVDMSLLPDWMGAWSDLDRLLALWEWRMGPTPWLWMRAHAQTRA